MTDDIDMTVQGKPLYGDDEYRELAPPEFDEQPRCKPVPLVQQMRVFREYGLEGVMEEQDDRPEVVNGQVNYVVADDGFYKMWVLPDATTLGDKEPLELRVKLPFEVAQGSGGKPESGDVVELRGTYRMGRLDAEKYEVVEYNRESGKTNDDKPEVGRCPLCDHDVCGPKRWDGRWIAQCGHCRTTFMHRDADAYGCWSWPDEWGADDAPPAFERCGGEGIGSEEKAELDEFADALGTVCDAASDETRQKAKRMMQEHRQDDDSTVGDTAAEGDVEGLRFTVSVGDNRDVTPFGVPLDREYDHRCRRCDTRMKHASGPAFKCPKCCHDFFDEVASPNPDIRQILDDRYGTHDWAPRSPSGDGCVYRAPYGPVALCLQETGDGLVAWVETVHGREYVADFEGAVEGCEKLEAKAIQKAKKRVEREGLR